MCSLIRQEQESIRQERRLYWCYSLNIKDLLIVLKHYKILKILVITYEYIHNKIFTNRVLVKKFSPPPQLFDLKIMYSYVIEVADSDFDSDL